MRILPILFSLLLACGAKPEISTPIVHRKVEPRPERYDCLSGGHLYTVVRRSSYGLPTGVLHDLKMTDIGSDGTVDLVSYTCAGASIQLDRRNGDGVDTFQDVFKLLLKRAQGLTCQDNTDYDGRKTIFFREQSPGWQEGEYSY